MERNNKITTFTDKYKKTPIAYDTKGEERLRACLKINKRHVMVMFEYMNALNTSEVQNMNARAQQ